MHIVGELGASGSIGGRVTRFVSRYRTRIYAALGGAAFWVLSSWGGLSFVAGTVAAGLALVSAVILLPRHAATIAVVEDAINRKLALVTPARLVRALLLTPIVACVVAAAAAFDGGKVPNASELLALLGAVNGLHAVAVIAAYQGHGERICNTVLAMTMGIWLVTFSGQHWSLWLLIFTLDAIFIAHIAMGVLSDLRSRFFPRAGVGVFFGSFNPVHKMHLELLKDLLERRKLEQIYVHATTIPKLHRDALSSGEIEVTRRAGVREYRKSKFADPGKNYFPTGAWFYEYDLRLELLKSAIRDAGLEGRVEVLDLPDIYERSGFFGVLRYVKARHEGQAIHGLHGSDAGGMWVRNIFDGSGWIYPYPVVRTGHVSATAIREGAVGLTSATVEKFLAAKRCGDDFVFPSGYVFRNCRG